MTRRLLGVFIGFLAIEAAVFYWRHHDLVRLSLSRDAVIADRAFAQEASSVLATEHVSRRVLERIADVAEVRGEHVLRIRALEQIVVDYPGDGGARVRLAQAIREVNRLEVGERIYGSEVSLDRDKD